MRILIFSQYFPPEVTAASARLQPFAAGLAERGHEVEVICEVPNHPSGVVHEDFRGRPWVRRELDGFAVTYVWVKASPVKTARTRFASYGSYVAMAAARGVASRRPDVVFASSPPLPVGVAAAVTALRHRVPLVLDIRDLWPEAAVALGELTNATVIQVLEWLERRLYGFATAITTVTESFRSDIAAKTEDSTKISVIPNGTTQMWLDAGSEDPDGAALGMPGDKFVWTYAGNVGIAQGLETAVEAAGELDDGFQLQVVGNGPVLERLKAQAAALPPGKVTFRGLVQPREAARLLRASEAVLVSLAAEPMLAKFVPSKLFDGCAVGRPVILSAIGESRRLAEAADAALPVSPGDSAALAATVRKLKENPDLGSGLSERGRVFAAAHLRERQVERLEEVLLGVVKRS